MASASELLAVCSWDFSPDPANIYSLSVLHQPLEPGPNAADTQGEEGSGRRSGTIPST